LWIPYAFLEGKKAGETSAIKSTPRTLKEIRQQYPGVYRGDGREPQGGV
jgi:hypothetical protein